MPHDLVRDALRGAVERMTSELDLMPLARWNESIFRYFFCRAIAESDPNVTQFVECGRIDLVLHGPDEKAFVEFKFYPYTGAQSGYKGGPGPQNRGEFRRCVEQLHARISEIGLSKYLVLVYTDPVGSSPGRRRFGSDYDEYRHPDDLVPLEQLATIGPIEHGDDRITARLFAIA